MPDGTVARVGKRALPPDEAIGEFIGLTRLGARGAATVARTLDQLAQRFAGRETAAVPARGDATATPTSPTCGRS